MSKFEELTVEVKAEGMEELKADARELRDLLAEACDMLDEIKCGLDGEPDDRERLKGILFQMAESEAAAPTAASVRAAELLMELC